MPPLSVWVMAANFMSKAALLTALIAALVAALHIRITRCLTSRYLRCKLRCKLRCSLRCIPLVGRAEFVPLVAAIFFVLFFVLPLVLLGT